MELVAVVQTIILRRAKLQLDHHQQNTNTEWFCKPDAFPASQPMMLKHWRQIVNIQTNNKINTERTW